jgi:hypothetical protein
MGRESKWNMAFILKAYNFIEKYPGCGKSDLQRHMEIASFASVESLLSTMASEGYLLSEKKPGKLYPFRRPSQRVPSGGE